MCSYYKLIQASELIFWTWKTLRVKNQFLVKSQIVNIRQAESKHYNKVADVKPPLVLWSLNT